MFRKCFHLLIFSVILLAKYSYGENDSSPHDDGFGYKILQFRLDYLQNSQSKLSELLTKEQETTNKLLNQILVGVLTTANNTSPEMKKQKLPIESCGVATSSGVQKLSVAKSTTTTVYCEMETFDGGWLVVQQRLDGSVNFTRTWEDYRDGFGQVGKSSEFWLGLEVLHQITSSGDYELLIELKNETGKYGYARYSMFRIAGDQDKYRLSHLGDYIGTTRNNLEYHKDRRFSTFDQDNDDWKDGSCTRTHSGGGWWFGVCSNSMLNGSYNKNSGGYGIFWSVWSNAATFSRMMIRRKLSQ